MSVAGAAIAVGALAKGALTVGLLAAGHDDYFLGTDVLGAELDPNVRVEPLLDSRQYWTSVAAGLTVAGILTVGGTIVFRKGRR